MTFCSLINVPGRSCAFGSSGPASEAYGPASGTFGSSSAPAPGGFGGLSGAFHIAGAPAGPAFCAFHISGSQLSTQPVSANGQYNIISADGAAVSSEFGADDFFSIWEEKKVDCENVLVLYNKYMGDILQKQIGSNDLAYDVISDFTPRHMLEFYNSIMKSPDNVPIESFHMLLKNVSLILAVECVHFEREIFLHALASVALLRVRFQHVVIEKLVNCMHSNIFMTLHTNVSLDIHGHALAMMINAAAIAVSFPFDLKLIECISKFGEVMTQDLSLQMRLRVIMLLLIVALKEKRNVFQVQRPDTVSMLERTWNIAGHIIHDYPGSFDEPFFKEMCESVPIDDQTLDHFLAQCLIQMQNKKKCILDPRDVVCRVLFLGITFGLCPVNQGLITDKHKSGISAASKTKKLFQLGLLPALMINTNCNKDNIERCEAFCIQENTEKKMAESLSMIGITYPFSIGATFLQVSNQFTKLSICCNLFGNARTVILQ